MACCPAHQDREPSLCVTERNGSLLVYCHAGCPQREVIRALKSLRLWRGSHRSSGGVNDTQQRDQLAAEIAEDARHTRIALKIWADSKSSPGTLVERYLAARGLDIASPEVLRFHPGLKHRSGKILPAMVALVTEGMTGDSVAIHRTFLSPDGLRKTDLAPDRMMLGPCRGGAVRFGDASGSNLLIGEGIETCLSAMKATGRPTWAALSASNLGSFDLPSQIRDVVVLADGDERGEQAAQQAAIRWRRQGRQVRIACPPRGYDFNDMLLGRSSPGLEQ